MLFENEYATFTFTAAVMLHFCHRLQDSHMNFRKCKNKYEILTLKQKDQVRTTWLKMCCRTFMSTCIKIPKMQKKCDSR